MKQALSSPFYHGDMPVEYVIALEDFIRRTGGLENAQLAVEMLEQPDGVA